MKKVVAIMALVVVALLAFSGSSTYAAGSEVTLGALNGSGQDGTATFTDMGGGSTKVVIDIKNGSSTAQPAHIHKGTCANLDPTPAYPLSNVVDGKSETTVNVSIDDLQKEPFAVNIHKSAAEVATYTSCGNIIGLTMTTQGSTGGSTLPASGAGNSIFLLAAIAALAIALLASGLKLARRKA